MSLLGPPSPTPSPPAADCGLFVLRAFSEANVNIYLQRDSAHVGRGGARPLCRHTGEVGMRRSASSGELTRSMRMSHLFWELCLLIFRQEIRNKAVSSIRGVEHATFLRVTDNRILTRVFIFPWTVDGRRMPCLAYRPCA